MAEYTVYVYFYDEFTALPDESNATAGTQSITTGSNLVGYPIVIEDDDGIFDEIDNGYPNDGTTPTDQVTAQDTVIDINGTTFVLPAGVPVSTAYDLIDSTSGHQVTTLHFYGNGYQQGPVDAVISTVPLESDTTYDFDIARTSHQQDNQYQEFIQCFGAGTLIDTPEGPRPIEEIELGDLVCTLDGPPREVRWHGSRTVPAMGSFAPIVVAPGLLGNERELVLSPQHRVLLSGWRAQLVAGEDEVLAAVVHLLADDRVHRRTGGTVTYHHIMFDAHEIVMAEGAPCESFLPGRLAVEGVDDEARCELAALFPEIERGDLPPVAPARRILAGFEARALIG